MSTHYTLGNATNRKEPREYAQKIIRAARNANLPVPNQLDIIYNGLDLDLRRDIKRSRADATINSFLTELDECKHNWWGYTKKSIRGQPGQAPKSANRPVDSRYDNQRGGYNQYNQSRQL